MNSFVLAILLTAAPLLELRIGLPVALFQAKNLGISYSLVFFLVIAINLALIFGIFFFLDTLNKTLLKWKPYARIFRAYEKKSQKKIKEFEKQYSKLGYVALMLFVSVPLPFTGVYTGAFISWVLGLDRRKSIIAMASGVLVAGFLIYLGTIGAFALVN